MKIELTNKTKEKIEEIKNDYPNGHTEEKGGKIYWVFESKVKYGV